MGNKNIQYIADNALCSACGGCYSVCPVSAISLEENIAGYKVAKIDFDRCINCGKCYQICPSVMANTPKINKCGVDIFHGECLGSYVGYATDSKIRQQSQSGGIVTALLCYLIDCHVIDGAVVNKFNKKTKRPEAFFEKEIEGIKESSGSYYSQSSVVNEVLKHQNQKTAAVILGCQGECLQLIREKYPEIVLPKYLIGLVCAGQYSGNYIDQLMQEAGCCKQDVTEFRFKDKRHGGWPGNTRITTTNQEYVLNKTIRQVLKPVFEVHRCLFCFDQMNIFSDITVGDPWGITNKSVKEGNSIIIARTKKGKSLIEAAFRDGIINVENLPVENIIKGQTVNDRLKTQFFTVMEISQQKDLMPPFNVENLKNISSYEKASKEKYKEIELRLRHSKEIYLESSRERYVKVITSASRKAIYRMKIQKIINFPKKCLRYALRKLKIR